MMPKVSIVVPIYNVERYLRNCIESIITQSLKDIETWVTRDDFTVEGYECHEAIAYPFAV